MGLREDINLVGDNYQWLGTSSTILLHTHLLPTTRVLY